jgi:hypothetical protein
MAEIVSLSKVRKARKRAEKSARATENAAKFGRTLAERAQDRALEAQRVARLEAHRRDPEPE